MEAVIGKIRMKGRRAVEIVLSDYLIPESQSAVPYRFETYGSDVQRQPELKGNELKRILDGREIAYRHYEQVRMKQDTRTVPTSSWNESRMTQRFLKGAIGDR